MSKQNVLFISPEFFGIEKSLISAMENYGYNVSWYDERSIRSSFARALNSVSNMFFCFQSDKYYQRIIESIDTQVDIILIVKGDMVSKNTIDLLRKRFPNAELILYLWDPVRNIKGILPKLKYYDRIISFEPKDCKEYGFEFRALFCDIEKVINYSHKESVYDVSFYGTMYGDRFRIVHLMNEFCKLHNKRFYSFCFLRGKFMNLFYYLTNSGYRMLGSKAISYRPKSSREIAEIIKSTKVVLDINDIHQEGLTIRTLETIANGKKIITTNSDIMNYDFYNQNNIFVIDRDNVDIPEDFFQSDYEPIPENILEKYTAQGWVKDVFKKS